MSIDIPTAVTDSQASRVTAVNRRTLRYWDQTGLVQPDVEQIISPRNVVRLYSFARLIELVVVAQLRAQRVSLQHIRKVVGHLRTRGYEDPLRELRFAISGDRVLFQHADGGWEDSRHPFQGVITQVLDLAAIGARITHRLRRDPHDAGIIETKRKVQASKPVFKGTRVPVDVVLAYLRDGKSEATILKAFPSLTKEDIEAAKSRLIPVA